MSKGCGWWDLQRQMRCPWLRKPEATRLTKRLFHLTLCKVLDLLLLMVLWEDLHDYGPVKIRVKEQALTRK